MKLLTIIVPCYNAEKFIDNFVENSMTLLTHSNIDFIFIDDGSLDNTFSILKKYQRKFKNIRIETQKNRGVSNARNKGVKLSNSIWLWFCDIDDIIMNQDQFLLFLNKLDIIKENIIHFNVNRRNYITNKVLNNQYINCSKPMLAYNISNQKLHFEHTAWSKIYRKKIFNNVMWCDGIICEDFILWSYIASNYNILYFNFTFYQYSTKIPNSILNKMSMWKKGEHKEIEAWIHLAKTTKLREYKIAVLFLLTTQLHTLIPEYKQEFKVLFHLYSKTSLYKWYFKRNIFHRISYWVLRLRMFWLFSFIKKRFSVSQ